MFSSTLFFNPSYTVWLSWLSIISKTPPEILILNVITLEKLSMLFLQQVFGHQKCCYLMQLFHKNCLQYMSLVFRHPVAKAVDLFGFAIPHNKKCLYPKRLEWPKLTIGMVIQFLLSRKMLLRINQIEQIWKSQIRQLNFL